ncbi:MAG: hypothetical protein ACJ75B_20720 [Flavisolibacter sp.]
MKLLVRKSVIALTLVLFFSHTSFCQDLTGIWKGYFITDNGESYRLEFQVEQNKNQTVTGVSYSYGDNIKFYGKATMIGRFTNDTKSFLIQETKTVEVRNPGGGGTCIMNYKFSYSKSGQEEFLEGNYVGKMEDRVNPKNNGQWGDCGGGKVFLRRVKQSDFYVEPFLRGKTPEKKADSIEKKPTSKPSEKPPVKPNAANPSKPVALAPKKKPVPKPAVNNKATANKTASNKPANTNKTVIKTTTVTSTDSARKNSSTSIANEHVVEKPKINIPVTTRSRQNELVQTLTVGSEEISIRLYDNGEVDDDTISVYLDGKPLLTNRRLSTVPITLSLKMDSDNPEHTLVMVAENMGRIPPNTSLMIVQDGDKRYSVSITSTEQKNAMVRFRFQKKSD